MGKVLMLFIVLSIGGIPLLHAQSTPDDQTLPSKEKISKDLIMLRDSVNGTIAMLSQQEINATDPLRPAYMKMSQDLSKQKIQLDLAIEEVVRSEWNVDVKTRTSQTIDDVRREYKRIQSELNRKPE